MSGTVASEAGSPTGNNINNFSLDGRPSTDLAKQNNHVFIKGH